MAQTSRDLEIIVVDDGSTDHTWQALLDLQRENKRLVLLQQPALGASAARNLGVTHATGPYLLFLDSDDELLPDALPSLATMTTTQEIAVVCGGALTVDDDESTLETKYPYDLGPPYENQTGLFLAGSYLVRRDVFLACGGFDPACRASQHKDLALRLVPHCVNQGYRIVATDTVTVRIHAHRDNHLRGNLETLLAGRLHALRVHEHQLKKSARHYAIYCETAAIYAAKLRRFPVARRLFRQAIGSLPTKWTTYLRLLVAHIPLLRASLWRP